MFMPDHGPGDRLNEGPQSQAGPQNAHTQDQDKPYSSETKGNNTNSEQQHQQLPSQAYQQLPPDVSNWGVPAMQADLYGMQRPGSAQLTPPGMGQMVPGMGQMPNQVRATSAHQSCVDSALNLSMCPADGFRISHAALISVPSSVHVPLVVVIVS